MSMTAEQAGNYLAAILSTAVVGVLIPLGILAALLLGLRAMLRHAVAAPEGYLGRMFQDDAGKPSTDRLVKLVAVAITSWMCAVIVFSQPQMIVEAMALFMVGWGGVDLTKHWLNTRPAIAAAQPAPQQPQG
jgi:hypothetical protein